MGLKIAVAGKGGSGKTTVSVLLARVLSNNGGKVLLVDLDSDPNLGPALGLPAGGASPLVTRKDLIAERTGSTGEPGGMFILNPKVADILGKYSLKVSDAVSLLPVGTIETAGEGCFCPQTAFVRALLGRLVLSKDESVILDLEAGLEAFGRSAVEGLDLLLIVIEAGMRSVDTARRILGMAPAMGIRNVRVVANKVRPGRLAFLKEKLRAEGIPIDIVLPYSDELARRDLEGRPVLDYADAGFEREAEAVLGNL
ncbi:MAG: AAA family ATPase [Deltaproteobacteria bacterium]|nr:AAA family ATPase [Deltaproteobacteria bacterium]